MGQSGVSESPFPPVDHNEHAERLRRENWEKVQAILRAYGIDHPTVAEQRAYVGVLDRMGAFAPSEREVLRLGLML